MRKFSMFSYAAFLSVTLFFIFSLCLTGLARDRKPFSQWPAVEKKFYGIKIIVAETQELAHQGFCNASKEEFQSTVIWFPGINQDTMFVNTNPGFGTVNQNLQIVFLDSKWLVLDIKTMEKQTGTAIAPENTHSALEGIPEIVKRLGFKKGKLALFRIEKSGTKYFCVPNNNNGGFR
ncbi:MAG: hypothetical protein NC831_00620 [Candidatus Omnitrophica bacterium]|nr:hypothetical protein [Candidatus Omnitrophota bacterium]MCM8829328.1 hypothetical protein [Candidatus Omnitrophota bacterium]